MGGYGSEAGISDVKSGAVAMGALFGGIDIVPPQPLHILFRTQHTGNYYLVHRHTLHTKTIHEGTAYTLQKHACPWHQIGNAAVHARVYVIVRTGSGVYQFLFPLLGFLAVGNGRHAPLLCGHNLHILQVGETILIGTHALDGMVFERIGSQGSFSLLDRC